MSSVITVSNLSKKYVIGHQGRGRYTALRDVLANGAKNVLRRVRRPLTHGQDNPAREEFWALKDVGFSISQGDRVGIIGHNGAGKSTLLKILSRITDPTAGQVRIRGRVASLLEVGTGFHPELTGRENIFLNGAILGMSKTEITSKFDEIVAFAEVERFLDTPVKHYSSGMYVRLAFAVAAHLESEILVVDEVLAVGDARFQEKCMGRMAAVGKEGRTVLFVSHNMNAVEQLCTSVIHLESGKLAAREDDVRKAIKQYLYAGDSGNRTMEWHDREGRHGNKWFSPTRMAVTDANGQALTPPVNNDADVWITIEGEVSELDPALQVGYAIYNEDGHLLYWTCHTDARQENWPQPVVGRNTFRSRLPQRLLNEGVYRIELLAALYHREWLAQPGINAPGISVEIRGGLSDSPYWMVRRPGMLAPVIEWGRK